MSDFTQMTHKYTGEDYTMGVFNNDNRMLGILKNLRYGFESISNNIVGYLSFSIINQCWQNKHPNANQFISTFGISICRSSTEESYEIKNIKVLSRKENPGDQYFSIPVKIIEMKTDAEYFFLAEAPEHKIKEEDHEGMVYNKYNNTWGWL